MKSFEQNQHEDNKLNEKMQADTKAIPVIEEIVEVTKKVVEKARVKFSKTVHEKTESYEVPLLSDEIVVKRIPKNEIVDVVPAGIRHEGDVMIISVLKEVAVVEKRIMLVEEIHVITNKHQHTETKEVVVRSEEVQVERTEIIAPSPAKQ
jgi:stress response protein YsnF